MSNGVSANIDRYQVGSLIARPGLVGNEYYSFDVPLFQRKYSWEKKQWSQFFQDLVEQLETNNENLFLGTIITYSDGTKQQPTDSRESRHEIIDGQQRITTIMIFYIALYRKFSELKIEMKKSDDLSEVVDRCDDIIKEIKAISAANRLVHKNDRIQNLGIYTTYYEQLYSVYVKNNPSTSTPNSLYLKAYQFFTKSIDDNVKELFGDKIGNLGSDQLESVFNYLQSLMVTLGGAELIWARVSTLSYAIKIFDTLNSRGKPLGVTDLIKVHYLQLVYSKSKQHESESEFDMLKKVDTFWNTLSNILQSDNNLAMFNRFIRHEYMLFNESKVTERQLVDAYKKRFQKITESTDIDESVIVYEKEMYVKASIYGFILDPRKYEIQSNINIPALQQLIERRKNNASLEKMISELVYDMNQLDLVQINLLNLFVFDTFCHIWNVNGSPYDTAIRLLHSISSKLVRFIIRRNITNLPAPNTMEKDVPKIIKECNKNSNPLERLKKIDESIDALLQQSEAYFETAIANEISYMEDTTEVRFVLHLLEKWKKDADNNFVFTSNNPIFDAFELNTAGRVKWQIEHIMPQSVIDNPPEKWVSELNSWGSNFMDSEVDAQKADVHCLGNLTLVEHNSTLGTSSLHEKQNFTVNQQLVGYKTQALRVINNIPIDCDGMEYQLSNVPKWTESEIKSRLQNINQMLLKLLN